MEGERRLGERVQALRRGVRAAQAAKERVFHSMQVSGSRQKTSGRFQRPPPSVTFHWKLYDFFLPSQSNSRALLQSSDNPGSEPQRPVSFAYEQSDLEELP